ncbi:MAG: phage GP46 family protein [Thalassobaculaceae bacterium]
MDLMLAFDGTLLQGDLDVAGADIATDEGLRTAIVVSLFTDRRARDDDALPAAADDRRGWWGDYLAAVEGDRIGSRLWLLSREKQVPEVLARAEEYTREALAWLLEDRIATKVDVTVTAPVRGRLDIAIAVTRPLGDVAAYRFDYVWEHS